MLRKLAQKITQLIVIQMVLKAKFEHCLNLVGLRSCPSLLHVEL
jgi:hypothetical protein